MTRVWKPGEHCILRFVGHDNGVVLGYPQVLVEATEQHVVLYQPAGTRVLNVPRSEDVRARVSPAAPRLPAEYTPPLSIVRIIPRDAEHAVEVFLAETGQPTPSYLWWLATSGRFRGWKVNLQARLVEHELGFDTTDNTLDVAVRPDGQWSWKDESQLEERVSVGLSSREEAERWRAEGERVAARIEESAWPFVPGWEDWRPGEGWGMPVLRDGWDALPGFELDLNRVRPD